MVRTGDADAMVAGAASTTARVIEAGMMTIGLAPGFATPSSFFLMMFGDRVLVFADCAVNADPTSVELADIALASAESCRRLLREEPRVALLSFSTKAARRTRRSTKWCGRSRSHGAGPRRSRSTASCRRMPRLVPRSPVRKMKEAGTVAGRANVLIFPDLDAGNIAYKLCQYLGGAVAVGPILQGFARPLSDLSRGASVEDIVATSTVVLAQCTGPDQRASMGT